MLSVTVTKTRPHIIPMPWSIYTSLLLPPSTLHFIVCILPRRKWLFCPFLHTQHLLSWHCSRVAVLKGCLLRSNSVIINSFVGRPKQVSNLNWDKSNRTDRCSQQKIIKCGNKLWASSEETYCYMYTLVQGMIFFYWGKFFAPPGNPDHANEHWQSTSSRCCSQMADKLEVVNLYSGGYISLKVF